MQLLYGLNAFSSAAKTRTKGGANMANTILCLCTSVKQVCLIISAGKLYASQNQLA